MGNFSIPSDSSSPLASFLPSGFSQSSFAHVVVLMVLGVWLFGLEGGWLGGLEMGTLGLTDRDEGSNAEAASTINTTTCANED